MAWAYSELTTYSLLETYGALSGGEPAEPNTPGAMRGTLLAVPTMRGTELAVARMAGTDLPTATMRGPL